MLLIDVRTPEEYAAGHVPSSVNLPLADIESGQLPATDLNEKIVLYCRSGARAERAKGILETQGYVNVTNGGGVEDVE